MTTINRNKIIAEELLREHIRNRISSQLDSRIMAETQLRTVVRQLLETETGTEEPSTFTGINVLADLLEKIVPVLEDDYKMLTTSEEQRESFRNHIVQAVKNSLNPIEAASQAEKLPENYEFTVNKKSLLEKLKIDLNPDEEDSLEGEFIDVDSTEEDVDDFVEIDDQNETGRNFAAVTYKKIEKQIVDAYDMLADEEDQKMFYDYLITNMLLYFDKFEDELQPDLPNSTTPEYEEEKSASADGDTDNEEAAESDETNNQEADVDDIFADI